MPSETLIAAGGVTIVITAEGTQFSAVVAETQKQLDKLKGVSQTTGAAMSTSMRQAGSAGRDTQIQIGLLDNAIRGQFTRSIADMIHGLSGTAVVMNLLPLSATGAGFVVLAGIVAKSVEKFVDWRKEVVRSAELAAHAWDQVENPLRNTNDELQLTNDRLADSIAKLQGAPRNGLKEAIDEAIVAADKLGEHLDADIGKISEAIQSQGVSRLTASLNLFSPKFMDTPTEDISDRSTDLQSKLETIDVSGNEQLEAMRKQGASEAQIHAKMEELTKAREAAISAELKWARGELAKAQKLQDEREVIPFRKSYTMDPTERIRALTHYTEGLGTASDFISLSESNSDLTGQKGKLEAKPASEQMEAWRQQLSEEKAQHEMTLAEEADFWQKRADSVKRGSVLYKEALQQANNARAADFKQQRAAIFAGLMQDARERDRGGAGTASNRYGLPANMLDESAGEEMRAQDETTRRQQEAATKAFEENAKILQQSEKEAEDALRTEAQEGRLSPHQLALEMQAVHGQAASEWMQRSAAFSAQNPDLPVPGAAAAMQSFDLQQQQDDAAVRATSTLGELSDATLNLAQKWGNLGRQLSDFTVQSLDSLNTTLMKVLSTPRNELRGKHPWSNMGAGMAERAGTSALQYGEGSLMKALFRNGKQKPSLTRSDPGYFYVMNLPGVPASGASGGLLGGMVDRVLGRESSSSSSSPWSGISSIASSLSKSGLGSAIGPLLYGMGGAGLGGMSALSTTDLDSGISSLAGFAAGGSIPSNLPVLVGEHGPEILAGAGGRTVIPNDKIGGGHTINNYIDARGSTDPAAVEAAAHRAVSAQAPQLIRGAMAAVADNNRRVPPSRRL